jgi:hypothetical protein
MSEVSRVSFCLFRPFGGCAPNATQTSTHPKNPYGRMGIAGVSEDGFYFHAHYDGVNIMTGELSAMLAPSETQVSKAQRLCAKRNTNVNAPKESV